MRWQEIRERKGIDGFFGKKKKKKNQGGKKGISP